MTGMSTLKVLTCMPAPTAYITSKALITQSRERRRRRSGQKTSEASAHVWPAQLELFTSAACSNSSVRTCHDEGPYSTGRKQKSCLKIGCRGGEENSGTPCGILCHEVCVSSQKAAG